MGFALVILAAILDIVANLFLKKSNAFRHKGYAIGCILMVWAAFTHFRLHYGIYRLVLLILLGAQWELLAQQRAAMCFSRRESG